jgi:hypothetical protein
VTNLFTPRPIQIIDGTTKTIIENVWISQLSIFKAQATKSANMPKAIRKTPCVKSEIGFLILFGKNI